MNQIKILFMGTPKIAVSMLTQIIKEGYDIIGVVSQPDKKVGRKQLYQMPPVKECALQHQIPIYQPIKIKEEYEPFLNLDCDLIITCAYGQFIPEALLQYPTYGSINVHASLLPKLRGGAPIHKAIINGDKESGISIMRMVKKMDAGAVMAQCRVPIQNEDTMGSLYDKLSIAGAKLLSESIPKLIDGSAHFVEQEESEATFAYTIQKEEEYISFEEDVQKVYDHIRGLIPTPCGYASINNKKIKFHKVRMIRENHQFTPGRVGGMRDNGFAIATLNGWILVDEIQVEGKAKCDAKAFYNGLGKQLNEKTFNRS